MLSPAILAAIISTQAGSIRCLKLSFGSTLSVITGADSAIIVRRQHASVYYELNMSKHLGLLSSNTQAHVLALAFSGSLIAVLIACFARLWP